jgi:hypothetical protein
MNQALAAFIARLKIGEILPRPDNETWKDTIGRISTEGVIAEITRDDYLYFLEVLPPFWMEGRDFCFAEGREAFRLFWPVAGTNRLFARQLTWDETVKFCELADIPLPS